MQWIREDFLLSDEKSLMDIGTIAGMLAGSSWASDRARSAIEKSIENSVCFGLATLDAHDLYRKYGFAIKECMRRPRQQ
jgi:hypothetical protein